MKKTSYCILFIVTAALFACSDSEDLTNASSVTFETPLEIDNYWTYNVKVGVQNSRDSLYIANDTLIAATHYKKFKTKSDLASGFYSSILKNNGLRNENGILYLSGELSINPIVLPINFGLSLTDFIIFNKNASNNQSLNSSPKTGTINQTIGEFPLTINYSLQSYGGENFATYTSPDGSAYTNVKSIKIKLNVSITTFFAGIPIPVTVLSAQDVLVSTQYLADGIGVVYTNTVTSYHLNAMVGSQLPIPETNTQTQEEFLDTYLVD